MKFFRLLAGKVVRSRAILAILTAGILILLPIGVLAAQRFNASSAIQNAHTEVASPKPKPQSTITETTTPLNTSQPVPATQPAAAATPTPAKQVALPVQKPKAVTTPVQTPCDTYIPIYYPDYNSKISAESSKHQTMLATLKQNYESNPYPGPDEVDAYYANTAAENDRHTQASTAIYNDYKSTLASVGCNM